MTEHCDENRDAAARSARDEPRCGTCGHAKRAHMHERGVCCECRPAPNWQPHPGWWNRYRRPPHETDDDLAVIRQWTGREANALRCAARMSVRSFADHLGISARAVSRWAKFGADTVPRPYMQAILDTALARVDEPTQRRFDGFLADNSAVSDNAESHRGVRDISSDRY